jgi:hypothetical protein
MRKRTPSLLHRGYLYAQKREANPPATSGPAPDSPSGRRMRDAKIWRDGYLAALRETKEAHRGIIRFPYPTRFQP